MIFTRRVARMLFAPAALLVACAFTTASGRVGTAVPLPPCAMCLDWVSAFEGEAPNHTVEDVSELLLTSCATLGFEHFGNERDELVSQCLDFVDTHRDTLAQRLVDGATAQELCDEYKFCEDPATAGDESTGGPTHSEL